MYKNKKGFILGFTLLEAIIAIASISLVSVFIMQMFVVSSRVNKRAQDIDRANMVSMGVIEEFKSRSGPIGPRGDYYEEYFDNNWDPTNDVNMAAYTLQVSVYSGSAGIFYIQTRVTAAGNNNMGNTNNTNEELVNLRASKYFPDFITEGSQ